MQPSRPIKILIGFLTLWVILYPLVFLVIWFPTVFLIPIMAEQSQSGAPFAVFMLVMLLMMGFMLLSSVVLMIMQVYYLWHVIVNQRMQSVLRVILGIGVFYFPIIAMPLYYFLAVLPAEPPAWSAPPAPVEPAAG